MFQSKTKDNSSLSLKILLRKSFLGIGAVPKRVALDLFSGKGEIARRAYLDFPELHLVEKNPRQVELLKAGFAGLTRARIWEMDNLEFLQKHLPGFPGLSLVDFDAYGSPNKQIQAFFSACKIREPILIFATDGGVLATIRGRGISPDLYLAGSDQGWGAGYDPVIGRNYERMIRCFWDELSKRHNFRIELFKIIWKKGGQLAYYGLLIKPR